jgi:hypothetical protein
MHAFETEADALRSDNTYSGEKCNFSGIFFVAHIKGLTALIFVPELRRILYALDLRAAAGHHLQRAAGALRGDLQSVLRSGDGRIHN